MAFAHVLSSSDDEDFTDIVNRRPNNVRRRFNHFDEFDDVDFHTRFRLSKKCITVGKLPNRKFHIRQNGKYTQHYKTAL